MHRFLTIDRRFALYHSGLPDEHCEWQRTWEKEETEQRCKHKTEDAVRLLYPVEEEGLGTRDLMTARYLIEAMTVCRGIANFKKKGTVPEDTCRMVWGNGVRAGMYPLSETEAYWFTCFNADANVSLHPAHFSTGSDPAFTHVAS